MPGMPGMSENRWVDGGLRSAWRALCRGPGKEKGPQGGPVWSSQPRTVGHDESLPWECDPYNGSYLRCRRRCSCWASLGCAAYLVTRLLRKEQSVARANT
jgi:hypothetical protein